MGVSGGILTREEETPVFVEEVGDEGVFPAEDAHLGAVLRGGVLDPNLDLVAADLGIVVVDERGLPGATATSCFGIRSFFRVPQDLSRRLQPSAASICSTCFM